MLNNLKTDSRLLCVFGFDLVEQVLSVDEIAGLAGSADIRADSVQAS